MIAADFLRDPTGTGGRAGFHPNRSEHSTRRPPPPERPNHCARRRTCRVEEKAASDVAAFQHVRKSAIAAKTKRPTASCRQSATRTVRLGGHVQFGRDRPENPRNHFLRKQSLTSGLPIGSGRKSLAIWAH